IEDELFTQLPDMAKKIINTDDPRNTNFYENPDDPVEHAPDWHQFGIISHTKKFSEAYKTEAQDLMQEWGVKDMADKVLSEDIDGRSKDELFRIAAILHDLGKFDRLFKVKDGKETNLPTHTGHEAKAADYILNDEYVHNLLAHDYGLTEDQIKYVAECTRLHYELGKIRKVAKKTEEGYTLAFSKTDKCKDACKEIADQFPNFKVEVGILFMCDSMAKTDIVVKGETDEEIEAQSDDIKQILDQRGLNPKLIRAVLQRPVNNAMAKAYFKVLKESEV
ncbi:hypothetical protein ACFLZH_03800, partial [Patescibacteria group bacterium]